MYRHMHLCMYVCMYVLWLLKRHYNSTTIYKEIAYVFFFHMTFLTFVSKKLLLLMIQPHIKKYLKKKTKSIKYYYGFC